jgi:lysozyme
MRQLITNEALGLLKEEEGYRQFPYLCSAGKTTIGYGFNLDDVGISKDEAELLLEFRLRRIEENLFHNYYWFRYLNENRKAVILSMVYQLGLTGFLKFKKMIKALEAEDYTEASIEMLNSLAAKQTPKRFVRQAEMLSRG